MDTHRDGRSPHHRRATVKPSLLGTSSAAIGDVTSPLEYCKLHKNSRMGRPGLGHKHEVAPQTHTNAIPLDSHKIEEHNASTRAQAPQSTMERALHRRRPGCKFGVERALQRTRAIRTGGNSLGSWSASSKRAKTGSCHNGATTTPV